MKVELSMKKTLYTAMGIGRYCFAMLLIIAACFKVHDLATRPVTSDLYHIGGLLHAEIEILAGLTILSSYRRHDISLVAVVLFTLYAFVAVYKIYSLNDTCGCAGSAVKTPPLAMVVIDLVAIGIFLVDGTKVFYETKNIARENCRRMYTPFVVVGIVATCGLSCSTVLWHYAATQVAINAELDYYSKERIVVDTGNWLGQKLPLTEKIQNGEMLTRGCWLVVFYDVGCEDCKQVWEAYQDGGHNVFGMDSSECENVMFVQVGAEDKPRYTSLSGIARACYYGRLSTEKRWLMRTPAIFRVEDGVVTDTIEISE